MIRYTHVAHLNEKKTVQPKTEQPAIVNKEENKPALKAEKKKKKITPVVVEETETEVKEEIDLSEWLKDDIDE